MKAIAIALLFLAGCSAPADPLAGVDHESPIHAAPPGSQAPQTRDVTLVEVSGGPLPTGVVPLSFGVDYKFVEDVQWEIIAAPNMFIVTGVRGHGCGGTAWAGGATAESYTYGTCDPFSPGDYELEAFFDIPVASYSVRVWGTAQLNATT